MSLIKRLIHFVPQSKALEARFPFFLVTLVHDLSPVPSVTITL
jgi:hypothetical protein